MAAIKKSCLKIFTEMTIDEYTGSDDHREPSMHGLDFSNKLLCCRPKQIFTNGHQNQPYGGQLQKHLSISCQMPFRLEGPYSSNQTFSRDHILFYEKGENHIVIWLTDHIAKDSKLLEMTIYTKGFS